jgi:hypothetical protein
MQRKDTDRKKGKSYHAQSLGRMPGMDLGSKKKQILKNKISYF